MSTPTFILLMVNVGLWALLGAVISGVWIISGAIRDVAAELRRGKR